MQIDARMFVTEAGSILAALAALHVGRAVAVYGCFGILRAVGRDEVAPRWQHVMVFGNIKGALSMAAVLALPEDLPYRDRFPRRVGRPRPRALSRGFITHGEILVTP